MRRSACRLIPVASILLIAACSDKAHEETQTTVTKNGVTTTTITNREVDRGTARSDARASSDATSGLSIDSDKFKANLEIPGLSFGGEHMDLDGMKLYPGSTVKGMHVHAVDRGATDKGEVIMDFASPAAPATVAQYMADQARHAGFALGTNTTAMVGGSKVDGSEAKRFAMTLNPNGSGTVGQLTLSGTKPRSADD